MAGNVANRRPEGNCLKCDKVKKLWQSTSDFFIHHTNFNTLSGEKTKAEEQRNIDILTKLAAALRNTNGGEILVHFDANEKNLKHFDESVGKRLEELIDDGKLYHDVYNRSWMSDVDDRYQEYTDFLVINVKKTQGVATVLFNTKIRNDFENKAPECLHVLSMLSTPANPNPNPRHTISELSAYHLQVSRNIELKRFLPKQNWNNVQNLVDYIWSDLKLKYAISSMSKVSYGGSFYIEVHGNLSNNSNSSLTINDSNFTFTEIALETSLKNKIDEHVCILQNRKYYKPPPDLVEINFHIIRDQPCKVFIGIDIRQVEGILFYDKEGPRTYLVDVTGGKKETRRMDKDDWLKRMTDHHIRFLSGNPRTD